MRRAGATPLVLAGDGAAALGVVAGAAPERLLWLDAHGGAQPRAEADGELARTALAALLGWDLAGLAPRPMAEEAVMLCGVRDLGPAEAAALAASAVARDDPGWLGRTRGALAVHLDLDVCDPALAPAVGCPTAGGWDAAEAAGWLRAAAADGAGLAAVTLAGYDPAADEDGGTLAFALDVLRRGLG